jgi:TonB family protein
MPLCKLRLLLFAAAVSLTCSASDRGTALHVQATDAAFRTPERRLWTSAVHNSSFSPITRLVTSARCEASRPPEALTTPNPLLDSNGLRAQVTVSFIVGTDGHVHSPLILDSLGPSEDRTVLEAVRSWRYRPATCNGVPTEVEGKIAFSSR